MELYKCACCEGNFVADLSEEEAIKEKESEGLALVCDDCYHQIMNFHEICTNGR